MSAAGLVFFDTATLSNFAAVGRLDLPATRFAGRAAWTETVAEELARGRTVAPYLRQADTTWLGPPLCPPSGPATLRGVEDIRRGLGANPREPRQSLGEAETMYYIERCAPGSVFVTDDRAALDMALRRGIDSHDTWWILGECYTAGELGCPLPYLLLHAMHVMGRNVRVPSEHTEVCP